MVELAGIIFQLPLVVAVSIPTSFYEFAIIAATIVGALFSAALEKVLGSQNRSRWILLAILGVLTGFSAGYLLRDTFDIGKLVIVMRTVFIFIGFVGGNFVHRKWESVGWKAFISVPAILLYGAAIVEVWGEHRAGPGPVLPPSPTPTMFSTSPPDRSPTPTVSPTPSPEISSRESRGQPTAIPSLAPTTSPPPASASSVPTSDDPVHRVVKGMESKDPATRLKTLREAVRSGDTYLRSVALTKAFAGSDNNLRSVALGEALQTSASLVVSIEGPLPSADPISQAISRSIEITIQQPRTASTRFEVLSSISRRTGSIAVSGQTVTFNVPADKVLNADDFCNGNETLVPGRSVLKGRMHCQYNHGLVGTFTGNYDIVTDLL
ncbi:MAG: hypothetical protein JWM87_2522 [Candidatus Eremiobacteraeota bacterium]|nr:hypothetical protein [Candidatus Eremiobacteraeota bacterium]